MTLSELKKEINKLSVEDLEDLTDDCVSMAAAMTEAASDFKGSKEEDISVENDASPEKTDILEEEAPITNEPIEKEQF